MDSLQWVLSNNIDEINRKYPQWNKILLIASVTSITLKTMKLHSNSPSFKVARLGFRLIYPIQSWKKPNIEKSDSQ